MGGRGEEWGEEWVEEGRSGWKRGGVGGRGEEWVEEGRSGWKRRGVGGRGGGEEYRKRNILETIHFPNVILSVKLLEMLMIINNALIRGVVSLEVCSH